MSRERRAWLSIRLGGVGPDVQIVDPPPRIGRQAGRRQRSDSALLRRIVPICASIQQHAVDHPNAAGDRADQVILVDACVRSIRRQLRVQARKVVQAAKQRLRGLLFQSGRQRSSFRKWSRALLRPGESLLSSPQLPSVPVASGLRTPQRLESAGRQLSAWGAIHCDGLRSPASGFVVRRVHLRARADEVVALRGLDFRLVVAARRRA